MEILNVTDEAFAPYGKIITGYDTKVLCKALKEKTSCPEDGTIYEASTDFLEELDISRKLKSTAYAGMPIQVGYCNGHNTKLNALEYHRGSELDIPADDIVLLLAKLTDISKENTLNSNVVKAFYVPKGTIVQIYETTLHFAPCSKDSGFRVAIVLPRGTNTPLQPHESLNAEDKLLWMQNKWLIAHEESKPASKGAWVGITGKNLDIAE